MDIFGFSDSFILNPMIPDPEIWVNPKDSRTASSTVDLGNGIFIEETSDDEEKDEEKEKED
jgi:hypothetical protein